MSWCAWHERNKCFLEGVYPPGTAPAVPQGGVTMADIQLSTVIDGGGDAIVFAPGEGNKPYISNVFVTHFTATKVGGAHLANTAVRT